MRLYNSAGCDVVKVRATVPGQIEKALATERISVVHIALPIDTSKSTDLYLSGTEIGSKRLGSMLGNSSRELPFVIIDVPRPPSMVAAVDQLVLRNLFAANLFSLGRIPVVLAAGLAEPQMQVELSETLCVGIAHRASPREIAHSLQGFNRDSHDGLLKEMLGTVCTALFAEDPELWPQELRPRKPS
jgi:hypothetical protein